MADPRGRSIKPHPVEMTRPPLPLAAGPLPHWPLHDLFAPVLWMLDQAHSNYLLSKKEKTKPSAWMTTFLADRLSIVGEKKKNQKSAREFEVASWLIWGTPPAFWDAGRILRIVVLDLCSNPRRCLHMTHRFSRLCYSATQESQKTAPIRPPT